MAAAFVLLHFFADYYPQHKGFEFVLFGHDVSLIGILKAFTAAAMIGGLADWFAVSALFRNPLRPIPIPHTAIIPKRKDEIGEELANFVRDQFLVQEVVERRLKDSELSRRVGDWLQESKNARSVSSSFSETISWFLCSTDSSELLGSLKRMLTGSIAQRIPVNKALAAIVDVLRTGNNTQLLIDELTEFGLRQIEQNREAILGFIRNNLNKEESGWSILKWLGIGKIGDEKINEIYTKIESECRQLLKRIREDQSHSVRVELDKRLHSWHEQLMNDDSTAKRCEHLRDEFLRNEVVQNFFQSIGEKAREAIHAELQNDSSDIRQSLEREIQRIGKGLSGDVELRKGIDSWLGEFITGIVVLHSKEISQVISDTIKTWPAQKTAESIELHIGSDLQFIRISGTLVGGFVGVIIYLLFGFSH